MLAGKLAKKVAAKTESMLAVHPGESFLILPVIRKAELRNVSGNPETADAGDHEVRFSLMERICAKTGEVEPDTAVIEAELVGHSGIDHVRIDKRASHSQSRKRAVESGQGAGNRRGTVLQAGGPG